MSALRVNVFVYFYSTFLLLNIVSSCLEVREEIYKRSRKFVIFFSLYLNLNEIKFDQMQ